MASRSRADLYPKLQPIFDAFLQQCDAAGIDLLVTCTYRSDAEQNALYAQGRTTKGRIVTNAKGGQSKHNFVLNGKPAAKAFDVVVMIDGKPEWTGTHPNWKKAGDIGLKLGLNWYGAPHAPFKELPHFQLIEG